MASDRWQRLQQLYHAALDQSPDTRAAFLAEACGQDEPLRREVESLLALSPAAAIVRGGAAAQAFAATHHGSPVGQRIGGYEVREPLGAGGMGEVYRARDVRLGRDVAIKLLPAAFAAHPDRLARFEREARVLASVNHPNIAAIYGIEDHRGAPAIVMELVPGDTLAQRIAQQRDGLPLPETVAVARQIVEALDAAHEKGIVHRDLKPSNITVTPEGLVKVLDFGLAKLEVGEGSAAASQSPTLTADATRDGGIVGTAPYMSPEQVRGGPVDKRTDIWAFGCVLYELLTGHALFARPTLSETLAVVLEREPDWSTLPATTPANIRHLLVRCLEKDPRQRLRDIGDAPSQLRADPEAPPAMRRVPSVPWSVVVSALAVVVVLLGLAVWRGAGEPGGLIPTAPGTVFSRLTRDGQYSTEPALSPDGTLVVYAADRNGENQLDLWVQRVAGGDAIRLTNDAADDRAPSFSPDGNLVAFRSERNGGGIYVMPALGGDARAVVDGGREPRFSPDGDRIAYWTGPWLGGPRTAGSAIFVVATTGGDPVRLASSFETARSPVWSPDGRSLLFMGRNAADPARPAEGFDWWWVPVEAGAEPVRTGAYRALEMAHLTGTNVNNSLAPVLDALPSAWTKDGVLFSAKLNGSANLWRLGVSSTSGLANTTPQRITFGPGDDEWPTVDQSGNIALQLSDVGYVSLVMPLDANAGRPTGTVTRQTLDYGLADARNSLDDAGRYLVYPNIRSNESQIWVKDLTTGRARHLMTTSSSQLNPVISRDGAQVAYTVPVNGRPSGYVIALTGGTAKKLCDDCVLHGWLPDNVGILAALGDRTRSVVIDTHSGMTDEILARTDAPVGRIDVSSDGRHLAFSIAGQVWMAPFRPGSPPGKDEWQLIHRARSGSAERACGWSPDSRILYLLLESDGFRCLYGQRVDVGKGTPIGEPFLVQHLHDPRRTWGSTPLGTAIVPHAFVFTQVERSGSIWLAKAGNQQP